MFVAAALQRSMFSVNHRNGHNRLIHWDILFYILPRDKLQDVKHK